MKQWQNEWTRSQRSVGKLATVKQKTGVRGLFSFSFFLRKESRSFGVFHVLISLSKSVDLNGKRAPVTFDGLD